MAHAGCLFFAITAMLAPQMGYAVIIQQAAEPPANLTVLGNLTVDPTNSTGAVLEKLHADPVLNLTVDPVFGNLTVDEKPAGLVFGKLTVDPIKGLKGGAAGAIGQKLPNGFKRGGALAVRSRGKGVQGGLVGGITHVENEGRLRSGLTGKLLASINPGLRNSFLHDGVSYIIKDGNVHLGDGATAGVGVTYDSNLKDWGQASLDGKIEGSMGTPLNGGASGTIKAIVTPRVINSWDGGLLGSGALSSVGGQLHSDNNDLKTDVTRGLGVDLYSTPAGNILGDYGGGSDDSFLIKKIGTGPTSLNRHTDWNFHLNVPKPSTARGSSMETAAKEAEEKNVEMFYNEARKANWPEALRRGDRGH